ncbi:MAG: signal peptide protein [Bacteroidetes bacterium]|nr:MAG: signal peptide protein [Bacteroidota bacterium]
MKINSIISLFLLAAATTASAQSVDDVIKKYTKATGGPDEQKKLKTVKMTGKMKQGGMDFPMVIQIMNGTAMRADITVQGMTIIQAFKDTSGWSVNPLSGATTAQKMNPEELKDSKEQSDLVSDLADYKARGHKVELIGKEDVEGTETYKVKLAKKDGDVEYYYLDAETYLPLKMSTKMKYGEKEVESDTYFSDYKDVGGVKMAHSTQIKSGGQVVFETVFDKIEANVTIDEAIFKMPQ